MKKIDENNKLFWDGNFMNKQILFFICSVLGCMDVYAIEYRYDQLSRLTKVIYDNERSINYNYDAAGNLLSVITIDLSNGGNNQTGSQDSDNDGIPDNWEVDFGLNPADSDDALADLDHDGVNNLTEYQQGRNPKINETAVVMPIILQPFNQSAKKRSKNMIRNLLPAISRP